MPSRFEFSEDVDEGPEPYGQPRSGILLSCIK